MAKNVKSVDESVSEIPQVGVGRRKILHRSFYYIIKPCDNLLL